MKFLSRYSFFVVAALGVVLGQGMAQANDVYIAQSAAGSANGSSCANAHPVSFFNSSANWGAGKIGPGTTVHLCGTITGAPGSGGLLAQGSGSSGNPITIHFEPNATLTAPYWGAAIVLNGVSYITVDGGGSGVIQNTLNGSAGTTCSGGACAYQKNSAGILAQPCSHCEIKNLTVQNLYMHNSVKDEAADQNMINAVNTSGGGITIDNNTFHDIGWAIACAHSNITVGPGNYIYNMDHGFAIGAGTNETVTGIAIYGNHFGAMANWDDAANQNHHDGVHMFGQTSGDQVLGPLVYNNLFDGDSGVNGNAFIYMEQAVNGAVIFNNVMIMKNNRYSNVGELSWYGEGVSMSNGQAYNNTIIGNNYSNGNCLVANGVTNFSSRNNVMAGCQGIFGLASSSILPGNGINNNVYENVLTDQGDSNGNSFNGNYAQSLSVWQRILPSGSGQDLNARFSTLSQISLSGSGEPQSGSSVIGAGANLTSLCAGNLTALCSDITGSPRPTTGVWTSGAYNAGQSLGAAAAPNPPTKLAASVK